ncbi:MAG: GNAT family N-acetyltransferase [Kofleriaceae bacterium]|nr:GNAT family N-acetyltransferase [Kofleriaceae bacterium]
MPVSVRAAVADDHDAYVALFGELGVADPPLAREAWTARLGDALVAAHGGAVVGYAITQRLVDTGYVRNIVVAPGARRAGVGRALMDAIAARLRAAGMTAWCLNVKPDNRAAMALYGACGLRHAFDSLSVTLPWSAVARLPAAPPGAHALEVLAADACAEAEAAMGLYPGLLAHAVGAGAWTPLALRRDGAVVGATRLATRNACVFPLRVAEPGVAGALLRAVEPRAAPGPSILVVVEDDVALERAVLDAGATVLMRTAHLHGRL